MYFDSKMTSVEHYLRKLSGQEREPVGVICDHNYVKPWNAHADSQRTKPAKLLFMNAIQRPKSTYVYPDDEIDVVNVSATDTPIPPSAFDSQRTKVLANELERSLKCNLNNDPDGSELEDFPIENCSPQKRKMYREVMELINADILAKVVYGGQQHELIRRKITTERCARQLRNIFANTFYDFDILLWIHKLILDKGNLISISSYLNILQALSTKIPTIVDKILKMYSGSLGYEYLCQILKKQWDPVIPVLNQHKCKKLPGNPFLIMSCVGFNIAKAMEKSSRFNFWTNHLNSLCKTMYIPMDCDNNNTFEDILDDAIVALTNKITESKNHFPKRPVILAGWTIGALIACHVALEAAVDAVVCFGFPLTGINGSRGDLNDLLLNSKVPTLFIIGQNSNMCSTDDIEDFRSRMRAESGLIIVGGADDLLRISPQKMLLEGITQEIVDQCILDEIGEFLQTTLMKLPTMASASNSSVKRYQALGEISEDGTYREDGQKRKRKKRREYSPELPTSHKRAKHSSTKEISKGAFKAHLSSFSSETSSSETQKKTKQNLAKAGKKSPDKGGIRPPIGTVRIKIPKAISPLPVSGISRAEVATKKKILLNLFPSVDSLIPEKPASTVSKPLPFALNILPKKNDPVDVEKAFGNDSSFLPRPLTPPEFDDTIMIEGTKKVDSEFGMSSLPISEPLETPNLDFISPTPENIPISDMPTSVTILDGIAGSIVKPTLNLESDTKKGISAFVAPSNFKTVFQDGKILTSKNLSSEKLISSSFSPTASLNTTKAIFTVPSNTVLLPGQTLKTASGKILQLVTKDSVSLKSKQVVVTPELAGSSHAMQDGDLSLVADATGISDLSKSLKKMETSSSATLVKLSVSDKPQNLKQVHILKSLQARSAPTRVDTPEEMAEKRLAIQALNNSVGVESSPPIINKEPGYSICYAKPDGSIISRAVNRGPDNATYVRHSIIAHPPTRGRVQPILPTKAYRFYHK